MSRSQMVVGVVGLGRLGRSIAAQLVAAGHPVVAFDVEPEACDRAAAAGVTIVEGPEAVARSVRATLVVVGTDEQVLSACGSEAEGLLAGAEPGDAIILCATVSPSTAIEVAGRAGARSVDVVDAPLARGERGVEQGDALVLGGADPEVFERWRPILAVFASDIAHLGDVGAGQVGKMINNLLLWATIAVNFEGLRLAKAFGLDPEAVRAGLLAGSGANWALSTWDRSRDMPWAADDMEIALENFAQRGIPAPVSTVVRDAIASIRQGKARWQGEERSTSLAAYLEALDRP